MLSSSILSSQTKLTAIANGSSSFRISLRNDRAVAGLQFVLKSTSDIILQEIHRFDRTSSGNWTVTYNRLNDSTLSVVVVSMDIASLTSGDGVIAEVAMSAAGKLSGTSRVSFSNVVVADPQAQLVHVTTADFFPISRTTASSDFTLCQNFPNPFNPSTKIAYLLTNSARVRLSVFDLTGREVVRLVDQVQGSGNYSVTWNSLDGSSQHLSSGTYVARLQVDDRVQTRKMILLK